MRYIRLTADLSGRGYYFPAGTVGRIQIHDSLGETVEFAPTLARHLKHHITSYEPARKMDFDRAMQAGARTVPDDLQAMLSTNRPSGVSLHDKQQATISTPLGEATVTATGKTDAFMRLNEPVEINRVSYDVQVKAHLRMREEEWQVYPYLTRHNDVPNYSAQYDSRPATDAAKRTAKEKLVPVMEAWLEDNYMRCIQAHYEGQENQIAYGLARIKEMQAQLAAREQWLLTLLDRTRNKQRLSDNDRRMLEDVSGWRLRITNY